MMCKKQSKKQYKFYAQIFYQSDVSKLDNKIFYFNTKIMKGNVRSRLQQSNTNVIATTLSH